MKNSTGLIFIIAPTGKCGTNYMINVLLQLGLARLSEVDSLCRQDHFLESANLLEEYVQKTIGTWSKWSEYSTDLQDKSNLLHAIGDGLSRFVGVGGVLPVVLKTPSSNNLLLGPKLFPNAIFILMVRDGRDVTESGVLSNYWSNYEEAFTAWATGVLNIQHFIDAQEFLPSEGRWILVYYEDLVSDLAKALTPILSILDCPNKDINLSALNKLPVFGSTDYGIISNEEFKWNILPKTEKFKPLGRWHSWQHSTCTLFKKLAGNELISLGYEQDNLW